ncbi:serpin family protein [Dehalogenimonas etheniformans]|uniref:Serpin family protein n=1 Tax=Dehalogenimonas etheniformans TaxID=1536648 RepID=A0A2P5P4X2_9CHLR|nr:serpin family protein [Dehalogenimonas etheniformans]PPD57351.1 serpin family protein [Dehalogenimonas etheniformans]QNT75201.1 serpin family protein [Dehalogenimonas etheniformans]
MKKIAIPIILAAAMLFSGCAKPTYGEELKSDKARLISNASASDTAALVAGNTDFAMALYQVLREQDGNLFYSPYSISEALAMTWGGARNETEKRMADALSFSLSQADLHAAFNYLDAALASRGQDAKGKDDQPLVLKVVNAIWGQKDFTFTADYLDLLAQNYGAGLRILDFIKSPEESRRTINEWVAKETEQRIKDLIPQGSINELTQLVLTNAVYFNGGWLTPFDKALTRDGSFFLLSGQKVNVPMMNQTESMGYASGPGYQAVELKYDSGELSMVIILPEAGTLSSFESGLDGQKLEKIIDGLKANSVNLTMPKFEFDSSFGLKSALSTLGMPIAFSDNADFSGMDGKTDLQIQDVVHKAFISVNEAGTEAAAASGVVVGGTSMPVDQATVTLDHPFLFLIRDIATGAVIFTGRVTDPS